jgi:hypothetical protein
MTAGDVTQRFFQVCGVTHDIHWISCLLGSLYKELAE